MAGRSGSSGGSKAEHTGPSLALADVAQYAVRLVARRVDVIVTGATQAVQAAKQATDTIPIVMITIGDPNWRGADRQLRRNV